MARDARSYRAARRGRARQLKQVWRSLDHEEMRDRGSPVYVPMVLTKEEIDAQRRA